MLNAVRGRELLLRLAFLVAGVAAITACASNTDSPAADAEPAAVAGAASGEAGGVVPPADNAPREQLSGIKGKVLHGPVVGGPEIAGQVSELPFSAIFIVNDPDGNEVARFESDEEGAFELAIAPGDYVIVADESAPVFRPTEQPQPVSVPEGGVVELTLRFDTGMR